MWRADVREALGDGAPIYLADPFLIHRVGQTYLFFEILRRHPVASGRYQKGVIGYATCEDVETQDWRFQGIALEEPFHLSFPYVFEHGGEVFMIPETNERRSVRLYQAQAFPHRWTFTKSLLPDEGYFADSSLVNHGGYWWLFTYGPEKRLLVFHSTDLMGPYLPHPGNPVAPDDHDQRPAGRVLAWDGKLFRFSQREGLAGYGNQVHAYEITELSLERYSESALFGGCRFLPTGSNTFRFGWNRKMHHVDFLELEDGRWLVAVDGDDRPRESDPMAPSYLDEARYALGAARESMRSRLGGRR